MELIYNEKDHNTDQMLLLHQLNNLYQRPYVRTAEMTKYQEELPDINFDWIYQENWLQQQVQQHKDDPSYMNFEQNITQDTLWGNNNDNDEDATTPLLMVDKKEEAMLYT